MKLDPNEQKARLKKREAELQRILSQMKTDDLHNSGFFKQLEKELTDIKTNSDQKST